MKYADKQTPLQIIEPIRSELPTRITREIADYDANEIYVDFA